MNLLKLQNINTGYGKKQVLFNINLELATGETVLLIGSNGSGKSTLLKAIYRLLPIWKVNGIAIGIKYDNFDILNRKPFELIREGMVYIPQQNELFTEMIVAENLETSVLHLKDKRMIKERLEEIFDQLPMLSERRNQVAAQLSGGERKLLSLGMAMMNRPRLLLLDEPMAGVAMDKLPNIRQALNQFKATGTTLLIVEHRVKELFEFANRVIVMRQGELAEEPINSIDNAKKILVQ